MGPSGAILVKSALLVVVLFVSLAILPAPVGAAEDPNTLVFDGTGRYIFIALAPDSEWPHPVVSLQAYLSDGSFTAFWVNETPYAFGTHGVHGGNGYRYNASVGVYAEPWGVSQEVDRQPQSEPPQWRGGTVFGFDERAPGPGVLQIVTQGEGFVQLRVTVERGTILDYTTGFGVESFDFADYGRPDWGVRKAAGPHALQVATTRVYDYFQPKNWTAVLIPARPIESDLWHEDRLVDPFGNTRVIPQWTSLGLLEPGPHRFETEGMNGRGGVVITMSATNVLWPADYR